MAWFVRREQLALLAKLISILLMAVAVGLILYLRHEINAENTLLREKADIAKGIVNATIAFENERLENEPDLVYREAVFIVGSALSALQVLDYTTIYEIDDEHISVVYQSANFPKNTIENGELALKELVLAAFQGRSGFYDGPDEMGETALVE